MAWYALAGFSLHFLHFNVDLSTMKRPLGCSVLPSTRQAIDFGTPQITLQDKFCDAMQWEGARYSSVSSA
jgi:hypothetical protein